MTKRIILLTLIICGAFLQGYNQTVPKKAELPSEMEATPLIALKSNLVYDLTSSLNVGIEYRLSEYLTMDFSLNYNPWTFSNNRKFKHILFQPELRYWIYEPFNSHFLGSHLIYSHYNVGNLPFGAFKDYRYQGDAFGVGISYGYQWILSPRWNLEATIGVGYVYFDYTQYECETCGEELGTKSKNYFGPTKVGISLIYILK